MVSPMPWFLQCQARHESPAWYVTKAWPIIRISDQTADKLYAFELSSLGGRWLPDFRLVGFRPQAADVVTSHFPVSAARLTRPNPRVSAKPSALQPPSAG
jgi:hypothetical protein